MGRRVEAEGRPGRRRAFRAASRHGGWLPGDLDVGVPVARFGERDFGLLPEGDWIEGRWPAFHARSPGSSGHISLSRVGFSRDGLTAVVYGFVGSGGLSASGDVFVLRRTEHGWRIDQTHNRVMA